MCSIIGSFDWHDFFQSCHPNIVSAALVGKNKGHPAVFPVDIPEFFIRLLCPPDGLVADPFAGSGTTGIAALALGHRCVLIDNNRNFCEIARNRIKKEANARDEEVIKVASHEGMYTKEIPHKIEEQIRFFEDSPDFAVNGKTAKKKKRRWSRVALTAVASCNHKQNCTAAASHLNPIAPFGASFSLQGYKSYKGCWSYDD
jgi:hypothetical protein